MGVFNGKKAVDNITILALMAIIALILLFYFTGNLHTLFMDLERLNPKLNHNKVARVNRCLAKYNKEFENFGLSRKCLWNHPCPKIFKHYLCNFWVCSSWKSYLPCNHKNDYASLDGIQYCLEMGARYIELDVFNKNMCPYTEPVVLNGSTPGRYQYSSGLDFEDCLINQSIEDHVLNDRISGVKKYNIDSTPTLIINDKKFENPHNYKNLKKALEKLI